MMRVVLDTNVLVSSFFGGKPKQIIDLWRTGRLTLCLSQPIVDEYLEVLRRLGLEDAVLIKEFIGVLGSTPHCIYTAKTPRIQVVEEDPDDDKFIECAMALQATAVVSGDRALLRLERYMDIDILPPAEFLERMKQGPTG